MRTLRSWPFAVALLIIGTALGISWSKSSSPQTETVAASTASPEFVAGEQSLDASPSSSSDGPDLSGPPAEHNSPELAAVRFLELTEEVVRLAPEAGAEVQRSIASSETADRLSTEVFELLTQLRMDVPEGVVVHLAPLSARSVETRTGWDVSIWYVEVIVYSDRLAVEQWRTSTYSMVEEFGEWRMDGVVSSDGPVPTRPASAVGWSARSLTLALAGFDDEVLQP
jgi:hypothetical protein